MKTYKEFLSSLNLEDVYTTEVCVVNTNFAAGSISGETVLSPYSTPRTRTSAVDGFALKYIDVKNTRVQNKIFFKVIACNDVHSFTASYVAVEIMTGAKIPYGFDIVVKVEDIKLYRVSGFLCTYIVVKSCMYVKNENVKLIGEDFTCGTPIILKKAFVLINTVLILCYFGFFYLRILQKPRIALFATGDEISNCYFLEYYKNTTYLTTTHNADVVNNVSIPYILNFFKKLGISVDYYGCFSDNIEEFKRIFKVIRGKRRKYSIILSTGAVSKGKRDFVRLVFESVGGTVLLHGVKVKPGKPLLFGYFKDNSSYFFGLPGNVLATVVGVRFFVFRLILKLLRIRGDFFFSTKKNISCCTKKDFTYFLKTTTLLCKNSLYVKHHFDQESFKLNNMPYVDSLTIVEPCLKHGFVKTFLLYPNFC